MTTQAGAATGAIVPAIRYRDAPAAIRFLVEAFGFQQRLIVPGDGGTIKHAQLTCGAGMIMLGSARDDAFGAMVQPPATPESPVTGSLYMLVDDVDAHHDRAKAAGAAIVMAPEDQPFGGRMYACRDPEGHLWNFGSYDPWAGPSTG